MTDGVLDVALVFPNSGMREVLIVALRLSFVLPFLSEVATTGLTSLERVATHQLTKLQEVGNTAGLLKRLVK